MFSVTKQQEKSLTKAQVSFIKVGWMNNDLTPTNRGIQAMNSMLFELHEKELAKLAIDEHKRLEEELDCDCDC